VIEHAHAATGQRAHGQLLLTGNAQLAHKEDIQRRPKRLGNLKANGNAAARQGQDECVGRQGIGLQALCQQLAGLMPVTKNGVEPGI
jgi:hypothetical protein